MLDFSIKAVRDAGAANTQYEWRTSIFGAPEAVDDDQIVAAVVLVAAVDGAWTTQTILAQPDVPRCAQVTQTDAGSECSTAVEIKGVDQFDNEQTEVIRTAVGTNTVKGICVWKSVTRVRTKTWGTVAAQTIKVGVCDRLGLPAQILEDSDVVRFISDTTGAPADELTKLLVDAAGNAVINAEHSWVEPDTACNGTKVFFVELRPTIDYRFGTKIRPRGHVAITS